MGFKGSSWFGLIELERLLTVCGTILWAEILDWERWKKVSKLSKHAFIHHPVFPTDAMGLTTSSLATVSSLAMRDCNLELLFEINLFLLKLLLL